MSSDRAKRLLEFADAVIEALEGQNADLKADNARLNNEKMDALERAIAADARAERLRVAALEALNNMRDRLNDECGCLDCRYTLSPAVSTLTKALEDDKQ